MAWSTVISELCVGRSRSVPPPSETASDLDLLRDAQDGNDQACRVLLSRYGDRLYRVVHRAHGDLQVTEDVVQEAFVRAIRAVDGLENEAAVFPWLVRIALRVALDHRRKRGREHALASLSEGSDSRASDSPEVQSAALQLRRQVRTAIAGLDPYPREILTLKYFGQFSVAEIARVYEKSEVAVRKDLQRARERLRRRLAPMFEDLP